MSDNKEERIAELIDRAKREKLKGRYYVYEQYKAELQEICPGFGLMYDRAIADLARALRV